MSSRERWTVYPLLLLAIGLAVRAGTVPPHAEFLDATVVECREFNVVAPDGTTLVRIGRVRDGGGGRIEIRDRAGIDAIAIGTRPEDRTGAVEFFDETGAPVGELQPPDDARQDANLQASGPGRAGD